jgi:hypothetical protein
MTEGRRSQAAAFLAILLPLALAGPALAQSATVRGSVAGELTRGSKVTFAVTATHPDGWRALDTVTVTLTLRGALLEALVYEVDDTSITAGEASALVGTGDQATGRFFRVSALDIQLTTGGDRLRLAFGAGLLEDVPPGARFRFVATDDHGEEVSVGRVAPVTEEDGGFPWATVGVAVVAALLAGGLLGSRVATHRRPPSLYATVARRVAEDRGAGRLPR